VTLAALALLAVLAVACASDGDEPSGRPRVLATTSVIAEFAEVIAGDDAEVVLLVPPGVDPHSYDPPIDAARAISRADVLLVNGCALEGNLVDVILLNRSGDSQLAVVGGGEAAAGQQDAARALCDPHRWLSVPFAIGYAEAIGAALSAADPDAASRYAERTGGLVDELRSLDAELRQTLSAVPEERRQLVVFHDAFTHFAAEYGFELVASIVPTGSGQSASAGAIAEVVSVVRELAVSAVYYEPQFRSRVVELVAAETGAALLPLYSIPIPGEVESYAELMRANARSLVDGLGR
jgi:ABC-type Zn uptake system ZnuABC Zn-binding protein ZnuA